MYRYLLKRVSINILVIWVISVLVFMIVKFLPGDPVSAIAGEGANPAIINALRERLHLNEPIYKQYIIWLQSILKGDFGISVRFFPLPIGPMLPDKIIATLSITLPAMLISIFAGISAGIFTSTRRGKYSDQLVTFFSTIGIGIPHFWLAIFMVFLFGVYIKLVPVYGYVSPFVDFGEYLKRAVLPIIVTSIGFIASLTRHTRTQMIDVINQDYVRTSRSNGINENKVIKLYAFKNASIPLISIVSLLFRNIIGGSVMIENVFNIPGLGRFMVDSILERDFMAIQACTLFISAAVVTGNLIADIAFGIIDPRIREEWAK